MRESQSNIHPEMSMLIRGSGECEGGGREGSEGGGFAYERRAWGGLMSRRGYRAPGGEPPTPYPPSQGAGKWSRELEMRAGKDTAGISLRAVIPGSTTVNGLHKYRKNNDQAWIGSWTFNIGRHYKCHCSETHSASTPPRHHHHSRRFYCLQIVSYILWIIIFFLKSYPFYRKTSTR